MKKLLLALLPLILTGCLNIEYTGKKFTPQEHVKYVKTPAAVPLDDYILIGKFSVIPSYTAHPYVVEEAVLEKSREYGGDILLFNSMKTQQRSAYTLNEDEFGAPSAADRKSSDAEKERFGKPAALKTPPATDHIRQVYSFSLYKKKSEVKRQFGY